MKSSSSPLWNVFLGLLLWVSVAESARASSLVHAKAKAAAATPVNATVTEDEATSSSQPTVVAKANETVPTNVTKLTGVPQIDYIHDPNLPRELNGHNLTDYPFYSLLPEEIDFKCDGLHDGFYASVAHQCQVYHHCLFGTRYDFLCANYTAFDQRTFICHFASEVDCKNSPKHFKRNEALYKATTTSTVAPLTTVASPSNGRRRRPFRRRKPAYDYYDEYSDYADDYEDGDDRRGEGGKKQKPSKGSEEEPLPSGPNKALYDRPRVAPKIRRPVPVNERDKYDYSSDSRVIPTKASQEESSVAEDDKTETNKRKNKPRAEGEKRDRYRERDRFNDRDEESDAEERPDGERERGRNREDTRDRDVDRERPRNRRPAKKRKRPYDYYDDYEEVRRPKPRERPRYEDEDEDYEDDRYYRKPARNRDHERPRERERERDRYRPVEDEEERRGKPRRREYEDAEDRYQSKEAEERTRPRDNHEARKSSNEPKKQPDSSRGAIETPKKAPEDAYSDETIETDKSAVYEDVSEEKPSERPKQNWRSRSTTTKPPPKTDPVPAPRPAYITPVKKQQEAPRKPAGFRRPTTQKYSEEEVEAEEEISRPASTEKPYSPFRSSGKRRQQELLVNVPEPTEAAPTTQKLVPPPPPVEDFAPRAPKVPMSNRRRPFLPSRGGDPTLLRGLTPVGAKAFTAPRKEDVAVPVAQISPVVVEKKFPTGIEFRTRVGANLGVEQPRLTPTLHEESYSQEEDYSGEIADSEESMREDFAPRAQSQTKQEIYRITEKTPTPIRPTLRTTDFPSLADVHGEIEHHTQIQQESKERKYSSRLPSNQYQPQQQPKVQTYQHLGPQTFFSDNPKFQTNDPRQQNSNFQPDNPKFQTNDPRQQNSNFQPAFYQPIIKSGQGQVQVVHFQKTVPRNNPLLKFPQENSEDTDEYDVSFNDALQPISTLHPRNAQTGIVGSQRVSVRRRMPAANHQFNDEIKSSPKSESQRIAATIVHPHSIHPPASYTRNIYSDRPIFVR